MIVNEESKLCLPWKYLYSLLFSLSKNAAAGRTLGARALYERAREHKCMIARHKRRIAAQGPCKTSCSKHDDGLAAIAVRAHPEASSQRCEVTSLSHTHTQELKVQEEQRLDLGRRSVHNEQLILIFG
eukprot:1145731-Pelagomonas_calceolata.AAC.2